MNRVILTTGGTGGHIFPALAVAEEIKARFPRAEILFVGGPHGREEELAVKAGLPFVALPVAGVLGRGWRSLGVVGWLPRSLWRSWSLLRSFKPEVVLGFGGYAGFPAVLAAWMMRIPTAIHEQNRLPGETNRFLGKLVRKVLLSLPDDHQRFQPGKVVITGNPLRRGISGLAAPTQTIAWPAAAPTERISWPAAAQTERIVWPAAAPTETISWPAAAQTQRIVWPAAGAFAETNPRRNVLILGGSQGARAVNQAVLESLSGFKEGKISLWHQTGSADWQRVVDAYQEAKFEHAVVEPFIDDMGKAYGWADLVICRAGATTLAELTAIGKPSVLIPFPHATHNHQMLNARRLEEAGAALVVVEGYLAQNLAKAQLWTMVKDLWDIPGKLRAMGKAAAELGKPRAAKDVVDELERLIQAGK